MGRVQNAIGICIVADLRFFDKTALGCQTLLPVFFAWTIPTPKT
jgi:hypothetical protein